MTDQHDPTAAQPAPPVPPMPPVPPWQPPTPQAQHPPYAYTQPQFAPAGYAPPPPGPPAKRGLRGGVLAAIIGGGILACVAVGLLIGFAIFSSVANADRARVASTGGVVADYLAAVADSDAETALSYLAEPPPPGPLLTDEALAVSNELAPITDITVGEIDFEEMRSQVPVTYTRGDETVSVVYDVLDYDQDGQWEISAGTGTLDVSRFTGLDLRVNDQPIDVDAVDVFPGTYEFATGLANFAIAGATTVTVSEPYEYPSTSGMDPTLSDTGLALFRQAVRAAVDGCVASTALAAGCGLDLPPTLSDGTALVDGTVARTLPVDTQTQLESLEAYVGYDLPTLVEGDYIGAVDVSADCSQNGESGRCELIATPPLEVPYVDMAAENPTVRWD